MGRAGGAAAGMATKASGAGAAAAGRSTAGAVGGYRAAKQAGGSGLGGGFKGGLAALRGRGGDLSRTPPAVGSGMRLRDSFKAGGQAVANKAQGKSKDALLKVPSKSEFMDSAHSQ